MIHVVEITEGQRQLLLLALAQLAVIRPSFVAEAEETAAMFPGGAELYRYSVACCEDSKRIDELIAKGKPS